MSSSLAEKAENLQSVPGPPNILHAGYILQQTTFFNIFLIFSKKTGSDIYANCLLRMKYQILFSRKNKKNITCHLLNLPTVW